MEGVKNLVLKQQVSLKTNCHGLGPASNKAPRSRSLTPPPPAGWGGENTTKGLVGRDKAREGSLTAYGHSQNRPNLGEK